MKHLLCYASIGTFLTFFSCQGNQTDTSRLSSTGEKLAIIDPEAKGGIFDISGDQDPSFEILEFPEEIMLGKISGTKIKDDRLYVHDHLQQQILVFDLTAQKFAYQLSAQGEGPGEYANINAFDVDDSERIYVHDFGKKLLVYHQEAFEQEINASNLYAKEFMLTANGLLVTNPEDSPNEKYRTTALEVNLEGEVLQVLGGEPKQSFHPIRFFQTDREHIYINDCANNQIVIYNKGNSEIEKVEFSTDSSHKVGIVDFWVADEDNIFVATSIGEASDNKVLLSRLDENTKVTNYSTLVSSKDMFPVTGLPQKELNGEFSYFVYSEENYPAFIKYYQEFHQLPSFSLIKDTYVHQDYPEITIQKEKIDEIANLFQSRLKPNTILLKKL